MVHHPILGVICHWLPSKRCGNHLLFLRILRLTSRTTRTSAHIPKKDACLWCAQRVCSQKEPWPGIDALTLTPSNTTEYYLREGNNTKAKITSSKAINEHKFAGRAATQDHGLAQRVTVLECERFWVQIPVCIPVFSGRWGQG